MESWGRKTGYFDVKRNKNNLHFSLNDPDSLPILIALTRNEKFYTSIHIVDRRAAMEFECEERRKRYETTSEFPGVFKYTCMYV